MIKEQLPDSWKVTPLSEIAAINPTIDKKNIEDETLVSFVPMPAVEAESGRIDISICRHFKEVKKGYTGFLERDVIFAKITPCMENGKVAVIPKLKNDLGFGSTEFHVIRAPVGVSPELLYYYVSSKWFRVEAEHNMTGAVGQRRVPTSFLEATHFPLPPTNEQKRIVAKIEELFSELDNGIAALKTAREQLKVYRQAVLKHAFEGKLTAKWREDNADKLESPEQLLARIQQEREARYQQQLEDWESAVKKWEEQGKEGKKPGKPKAQDAAELYHFSSDYYLANIPADWACLKAEHLCDFITKGTTPAKSELFANTGDIPFIKVYNLTKNGTLDFSIEPTFVNNKTHNEFLARSKVYPNDVLMNIVGPPLGKVSIVPSTHSEWNINQAIAIYRSAALLPKYLSEFLLFEKTVNYMMAQSKATAGQFNLTLEICRDLPIPVPSFEEQAEIVKTLEAQLSNVDSISQEIEIQLTKSETLRQSILKKAFSGQLVPQDPNDEPASELLARIQAEQAAKKASAKPKVAAKTGTKRSRKPRVVS